MSDEELMELSLDERVNLINDTKLKIEKIKLQNLKKRIMIDEILNN